MGYDFDKSLGKLTQQVSKSLGKRLEERFAANGFSLKATDWTVISMLYKHGKQHQRDISNFMALDKVMIKRIIDRLENENIVVREGSEKDKRFNNVQLTGKGKKVFKQLVKYAEEVIETAIENIPGDDMDTCLEVLEKMKNNLL